MQEIIYYTFQVQLHRIDTLTNAGETHEFRDCTGARIKELRIEAFTQGIKINHTPTTWEVLSPQQIKQIFIIQQDKKYAL